MAPPRNYAAELATFQSRVDSAESKPEALQLAVEAVELCMKALKISSKEERPQLTAKCKYWLDEAERIKKADHWLARTQPSSQPTKETAIIGDKLHVPSPLAAQAPATSSSSPIDPKIKRLREPRPTRELSTTEKLVLAKASKLNGFIFPPWTDDPTSSDFQLKDGAPSFSDSPELPLSTHQRQILDGWKRAKDALPPPSWSPAQGQLDGSVVAAENAPSDLVQDAASDCSVVASLCAVVSRFERGHDPIIYNLIWPRDERAGAPIVSQNGKYIMKMYFNGCWRRVTVDDRLPVSKSSRMLHIIDRSNPSLLWPPLVEKAYLKVRGGYDFPGSSSCSDLWTLTGWIPEQVFLQDEDVVPNRLWNRIYKAFKYGDVLVTVGTGKMNSRDEKELGLEGQHNYAVLDLKETDDGPMLQIKNPWVDGKGWKGRPVQIQPENTNLLKPTSSGIFWISLNSVMQYFESVFINWNPGLFRHREDIHFKWAVEPQNRGAGSIEGNPQFSVTARKEGLIWFLLSRHFKDDSPSNTDGESEHPGTPKGFMSLSVYDRGERLYVDEGDIERGPLVNTPQALLRWNCPAAGTYTVVVNHQELEGSENTFTLSAFSDMNIDVAHAQSKYSKQTRARGAWTASTSGGNPQSARYPENPQFSLDVPQPTPIALLIKTHARRTPIKAQILHGRGERVYSLKSQDLVLDTGTYRHNYAFAEMAQVMPGRYTIICSTFEPGQLADFSLQVDANCECKLSPIPKEGAGMLSTKLNTACFGSNIDRIAAPLLPHRLTRLNIVSSFQKSRSARYNPSTGHARSPLRISIELGRGPESRVLLESNGGEFSNADTIRTAFMDISPEISRMGDIYLVLERLRGPADGSEELHEVQIFHDAPNAFTTGFWRNWD